MGRFFLNKLFLIVVGFSPAGNALLGDDVCGIFFGVVGGGTGHIYTYIPHIRADCPASKSKDD